MTAKSTARMLLRSVLLLLAPGAIGLSSSATDAQPVDPGHVGSFRRPQMAHLLAAAFPSVLHVGMLTAVALLSIRDGQSHARLLAVMGSLHLALVAAQWFVRSDPRDPPFLSSRALWPGVVQVSLLLVCTTLLLVQATSIQIGPHPGSLAVSPGDFIAGSTGPQALEYGSLAVVQCDDPANGLGLARVHALPGDTIWVNQGRVCSDEGCVPQRLAAETTQPLLEVLAGHYYVVAADPAFSKPPETVAPGELGLVADIRTEPPACLSKLAVPASQVLAVAREAWQIGFRSAPATITLD